MKAFSKHRIPVAFITGTSSGFGLLASVALAKCGYQVVASMRNLGKQTNLWSMAQAAGVSDRIEVVRLDVTNEDEVDETIRNAIARHGGIDVLINNAGYAQGGFIEEVSMEQWRRQFDTNFFGVVACTKAVLPHMRERGSGTIINIGSVSGRIGLPGMGPYAASKFALEGYSEVLRLEMLRYGVSVVLIEPGAYRTDVWDKGLANYRSVPNSPYADWTEKLVGQVKRIAETAGDPAEVVGVIQKLLQSPRPNLRYPVGRGIKAALRMRSVLPWKLYERMVSRRM